MEVLNEYKTHHYIEKWEKTNYHCPLCGNKTLWNELSGGDYYVGSKYLCTSCHCETYLDYTKLATETNVFGIIEQLKAGVTRKATTKRGC